MATKTEIRRAEYEGAKRAASGGTATPGVMKSLGQSKAESDADRKGFYEQKTKMLSEPNSGKPSKSS